ncbi:FUSC family protein [Microbacterium dauci]|uniref:FUSC family protein n=1 Tax=Microbacterium dauci TaxID=3048008 RepID=A0ABT6ZHR3_9MICO|nr:FUSC family protein [Microbacterium sp. LX3-4]MDJ1115516.1 FUSC family protein [Microbacterium sp. LX3-4]
MSQPNLISGALRSATNRSRLLLAAKASGAAVAAWLLAPLVPFSAAEYSYYAPLGVVVTMYPTLADSARSGLQTLIGLAAGIGLGLGAVAVDLAGVPAVVPLALVVAIGILLGGLRQLGPGREWITMAAMFVLLIGGRSDAETFSVSYLVTMAFGVLVGVIVNVAIAPPLYLGRAEERLSSLRDELAEQLGQMADATAGGTIDDESLAAAMERLSGTLAVVTEDVREADLSRRGNPRGRRHHADDNARNATRLRALERTVFFTRDLADVLMRLPPDAPALAGASRDRLADAIRACGAMVATDAARLAESGEITRASQAVEAYLESLGADATPVESVAEQATAAVCLRRIIDASRPFT